MAVNQRMKRSPHHAGVFFSPSRENLPIASLPVLACHDAAPRKTHGPRGAIKDCNKTTVDRKIRFPLHLRDAFLSPSPRPPVPPSRAAIPIVSLLVLAVLAAAPRNAIGAEGELSDYRGAIHCHSYYSHDSKGTEERLSEAANAVGLDFVMMTDHPPHDKAAMPLSGQIHGMKGNVLFVRGIEQAGPGFLTLGLSDYVDTGDPQGIVDQATAQGALAFLSHIEERTDDEFDAEGWTGMEIYNFHYDMLLDKGIGESSGVLGKYLLKKQPLAGLIALMDYPKVYIDAWGKQLNKGKRVVGVAANDCHENVFLFNQQVDKYERCLNFVSTHILATDRTQTELFDGLRAGHAYVAHDMFAPPKGFEYRLEGPGSLSAMMGDEVQFAEGLTLKARLPQPGRFSLYRDWFKVLDVEGDSISFPADFPGVYRLEAEVNLKGEWRPWIYSNPIYVRAGK